MLARYANDLATYLAMRERLVDGPAGIGDLYRREVHHRADASQNLAKLCALSVSGESDSGGNSFFELGQTLFGCIEGMEFFRELLDRLGISPPLGDLRAVDWYGVDISALFNRLAPLLHPGYRLRTATAFETLGIAEAGVLFAKGVTLLYAVRELSHLLELLGRGRIFIFDYSFALGGQQDTHIGTGKAVRYLDLDAFLGRFAGTGKSLYVRTETSHRVRETNRVFLDCVCAEETLCRRFMERDGLLRDGLARALAPFEDAGALLESGGSGPPGWASLDEFLAGASD